MFCKRLFYECRKNSELCGKRVKGTVGGLVQNKNGAFTTHTYNNLALSPFPTMFCQSLLSLNVAKTRNCAAKGYTDNTWTGPI